MKVLIFILAGLLFNGRLFGKPNFPNICDVVNQPHFEQGFELKFKPTMCGDIIPRPCAQIEYYVPKYFIEVVNNAKETFFGDLPGVKTQLHQTRASLPFAAEDDHDSYSFQAHTISIPFSQWVLAELPCGGSAADTFCFSSMSEHYGSHWSSGSGDLFQPKFLAWSVSPKACLVAGAATSVIGERLVPTGSDAPMCSFPLGWLTRYPPSLQPVCTGWGIHFPRSGAVVSSDPTTASLVIASRIRSLGAEILHGISISNDEKWQMMLPQKSGFFREGENIGMLGLKSVGEMGRTTGNFRNYLYGIWQKQSCTKDIAWVVSTKVWIQGLKAACSSWR